MPPVSSEPPTSPSVILISACLFGLPTRYDGTSCRAAHRDTSTDQDVVLLPVCPEQLGGLPTPRPPCSLCGGDGAAVWAGKARVLENEGGEDRTAQYCAGAERVAVLARRCGVVKARLKARSPSCGLTACWQDGEVRGGPGVLAATLLQLGVAVEEVDG